MTTSAANEQITAKTSTSCPSWCRSHLDGIEVGVVHEREVTVGDMTVTINETTGAAGLEFEPVGPVVVDVDNWQWISEQSIRNLAAALNAAADMLGVPEITA